jgi:TonB-linked SusC/RagA family outer membrane protein
MKIFKWMLLMAACGFQLGAAQPGSAQPLAMFTGQEMRSPEQPSRLRLADLLLRFKSHYKVDILYADRSVKNQLVLASDVKWDEKLESNLDRILPSAGLEFVQQKAGTFLIIRTPKAGERKSKPDTDLQPDQAPAEAESSGAAIPARQAGQYARTISGVVTDEKREPLPGVSVVVKGTQKGTITGTDGRYTLPDISDQDLILVFSYVGYLHQEMEIGNASTLDVTMQADNKALDEVVVVGYGEQKKSNVTGSIVSVGASDIEKVQSPSFENALQGKVPGVYVTTNGGQPGGGVSVRIRGVGAINNSNPLYIVDGVQMGAGDDENSNPLASINPSDIESIDILKDAASTAIYGTRAANGVVMITTKRGQAGVPRLTASTYYGIQNPTRKVPRPMNAMEYARNMNTAFVAAGQPAPFTNPDALGEGTNWMDEVLKTGKIQEQQISIAGGGAKNKYFLSLSHFRNDGMMLNTWFDRLSVRINTDNHISNKVRIGNSLAVSRTTQRNNGSGNRRFIGGVFTNIYATLPIMPVYDENGNFAGPTDSRFERPGNPVFEQTITDIDNESYNIIGNFYGEYEPIKHLVLRTSFSTTINTGSNYAFTPIWETGLLNSSGLSKIEVHSSKGRQWMWENTLTYSRNFGKHNVSAMLGTTALDSRGRAARQTASYNTSAFKEINSQGATALNTETSFGEESLASVFGRFNYDFADKYLLTATVRRDGSSKFGANKKFGVFPAVSGGWRVSEEAFFPKNNFLTDLKLRSGWGQVGSDAIGNFMYLARIVTGSNYAFGNQPGNSTIGAALGDLANPNIQWETVTEYNVAIESGLLNNRLTFSAEYFNRTRTNMLLTQSLPGVSGLKEIVQNSGNLTSKGFEFNAGYRGSAGKLKYSVFGNLTTYNNVVKSLGGSADIFPLDYSGSGGITLIRQGQPLGVFYGLISDGLYQTQEEVNAANAADGNDATPFQNADTAPGDFRYRDLNGDGRIDNNDKTIIGNPTPKFTYGFGGDLAYGNFDLSLQFFGLAGNDIMNLNRTTMEASGRSLNKSVTAVNAWSGPGTSNDIPRPILSDPNLNTRVATHLIENGSYLRLRNVQLGYNIRSEAFKKFKLSGARVYISVQNAFVLTKFSGVDPEVGLDDNKSAAAGIYNDIYPQPRTISAGLKLDF